VNVGTYSPSEALTGETVDSNSTENKSLLIVDDDSRTINSLSRELRRDGYTLFSAESGEAALTLARTREIGVVLSDQMMPGIDGITLLKTLKQEKPDVVRILLTGNGSLENAMEAINGSRIFSYLVKPWSPQLLKETVATAFRHYNLTVENRRLQKLTYQQNEKLKRINTDLDGLVYKRTAQLEDAMHEGIVMLSAAAEARDDATGDHIHRIRKETYNICKALGLSEKKSDQIGFFSIMHDVGKINIPDNILKKAGPLTEHEYAVMKTHTVAGEKILGTKVFYQTAREIARSHHERWDGNGYPDGLSREAIPLPARIVAVADVFDALTHARPYKRQWSKQEALTEMDRLSGSAFDPSVLDAFFQVQGMEW